jgi:hypothetical protein
MNRSIVICVACTAVVGLPITALASDRGTEHFRYRPQIARHHAPRAAARTGPRHPATLLSLFGAGSRIRPYPKGKGDTDGLSTNPNDCNKGCIGGNVW